VSGRHDFQRFVAAQDANGIYERAIEELRASRKRTHWMWFVFPQLSGLGNSPMAIEYGIDSLDQARAYLEDPIVGPRLIAAAEVVATNIHGSAEAVFGTLDALKLRSSMTLFRLASPGTEVFRTVLDRLYNGLTDTETERRVQAR
jgi:uncharacterized protein (DUF1810 family)